MVGIRNDQIRPAKKLVESFCMELGRDARIVGLWLSDVARVGDVCHVVASTAHAVELLGSTEAVQADVTEWVRFADGMCDVQDVDSMLQRLNHHLETRSVLAGKGMDISLADLSVFTIPALLDEINSADLERTSLMS